VHIGEPKTGTTFLQHAMWNNRTRLASQGVLLPGYSHRDHSRAGRDLRQAPRVAADPAEPWLGEWDILTRQALRARKAAVISSELLVACDDRQADRGARSLHPAELHVVLTVRDFATLLPAEWQETVKCRGTVPWEEWLDGVIGIESAADRRRRSWFWKVHDTLAIIDMWSHDIPPEHVHVITMPRQSSADTLWVRFASVLGIDSVNIDLTRAYANSSLGLLETEFLRRMNEALPEGVPDWFYTRSIKQNLAHDILGARPRQARLILPPAREAWAREQSEILVAGLRDSKYDIVGDLGELLPRPATEPYIGPADQPTEQLLDAAVHAAAAMADRYYREMYLAAWQQPRQGGPRQMVNQLKQVIRSRIGRVLRKASHRPVIRRLRVVIWCVLTRGAQHRP